MFKFILLTTGALQNAAAISLESVADAPEIDVEQMSNCLTQGTDQECAAPEIDFLQMSNNLQHATDDSSHEQSLLPLENPLMLAQTYAEEVKEAVSETAKEVKEDVRETVKEVKEVVREVVKADKEADKADKETDKIIETEVKSDIKILKEALAGKELAEVSPAKALDILKGLLPGSSVQELTDMINAHVDENGILSGGAFVELLKGVAPVYEVPLIKYQGKPETEVEVSADPENVAEVSVKTE